MSHSTMIDGVNFIHNGDYSGDVEIVTENGRLTVPFEALRYLVSGYVRDAKIHNLEQANDMEILGLEAK